MKKINSRGFADAALVLVLVMVVIGLGAWWLLVRSSDDNLATSNSQTITYTSQEECETAMGGRCSYVTCDVVPEGKTFDEVCGEDFVKGWQLTEDQSVANDVINLYRKDGENTYRISGVVTEVFDDREVDGDAGVVINDIYRVVTDVARDMPEEVYGARIWGAIDSVVPGDSVDVLARKERDPHGYILEGSESLYLKKITIETIQGNYQVISCITMGYPCSESNLVLDSSSEQVLLRDDFSLLNDFKDGDVLELQGYYKADGLGFSFFTVLKSSSS